MLTKETITQENALFQACLMASWEWARRYDTYETGANNQLVNPILRKKYSIYAEQVKMEMLLCLEKLLGLDTHNYNLVLQHFDAALAYTKEGNK